MAVDNSKGHRLQSELKVKLQGTDWVSDVRAEKDTAEALDLGVVLTVVMAEVDKGEWIRSLKVTA